MLDTYRRIVGVPGAWRFSAAALVARLPISMMGIGIVLLVEGATGSYGLAGAVSAAYVVANAPLSIAQGRLLDRWGQARVLVPAAVLFTLASTLLVFSVRSGWPTWSVYLLAAGAGAGLPAVGACVRSRWSHALRGRPADLQTAFALEAVVDEAIFVAGPVLVTVLATAIDPVVGLATAVLSGLLGSLALSAQRSSEPPVEAALPDRRDRPRLPWRTLLPLFGVIAGLGGVFGATEVVTVAWSEDRGSQAYAGPLLALLALGSLAAGLVTGAVRWRRHPVFRLRLGAAGMCSAVAALPLIDPVPVMGLALLVGGVAVAPTLIAATSLIEGSVPPSRLTEGMALLHTGVVAGVAPGAAVAGAVVDLAGSSAAYLVALAAAAIGALAAWLVPRPVDPAA